MSAPATAKIPAWAKSIWYLLVFGFAWLGVMSFLKLSVELAFDNGNKDRTPGTPESYWCCDGNEVPCAYGPGIVGKKTCQLHSWSRCEPDPRYLVNDAGR